MPQLIWSKEPKTDFAHNMEVLRQVDWEAHKRDKCVAANWAADEIIKLRALLRFLAGHQGISKELRENIKQACESNK